MNALLRNRTSEAATNRLNDKKPYHNCGVPVWKYFQNKRLMRLNRKRRKNKLPGTLRNAAPVHRLEVKKKKKKLKKPKSFLFRHTLFFYTHFCVYFFFSPAFFFFETSLKIVNECTRIWCLHNVRIKNAYMKFIILFDIFICSS